MSNLPPTCVVDAMQPDGVEEQIPSEEQAELMSRWEDCLTTAE